MSVLGGLRSALLLAVLGLAPGCGACASLGGWSEEQDRGTTHPRWVKHHELEPFGAIRYDGDFFRASVERSAGIQGCYGGPSYGLYPFFFLDMPISLSWDLATLPFTIPFHFLARPRLYPETQEPARGS